MTIKELFFAIVVLFILGYLVATNNDMHGVKRYDCTISEISPDYPVEVKEACRRIRLEKNKE